MCVCVDRSDPPSDLEKQLHQSGGSWRLGNALHCINNSPCASCMHNYRAKMEVACSPKIMSHDLFPPMFGHLLHSAGKGKAAVDLSFAIQS